MADIILYNKIMEMVHPSEDNNPELLDYIESHKDRWQGPKLVEEKYIRRTVGPEPKMMNHEPEAEFNTKVESIAKWLSENPRADINLLCEENDGVYSLLDGNHKFEALKKLGHNEFSVIYTQN